MHPDGKQPHILVVNHSAEILALKHDILESEGFHASTRLRVETDVTDVAALHPDLLIIDYIVDDDAQLLHQLTADPRTGQLPLLLCTETIYELDVLRPVLNTSRVRILLQPFEIEDFLRLVREALGLPFDPEGSSLPPRG